MSDAVHLLIPFASATAEGCVQALRTLALPQLEKLLARLGPLEADSGDENTLSTPHERVLARECGLSAPDGRIALAAWQHHQDGGDTQGAAWAWITPCHWQVGTGHVAMADPDSLQLDGGDSQALLAALRPLFEQDGVSLHYARPTRWLAQGEVFRELGTASLDRVIGRAVDDWMPRAPQAATVRRLQQEVQMLLYTHEVNEQRLGRGLLPVNSCWVSGAGALPAAHAGSAPPGLRVAGALRPAALLQDWEGWAAAWRELDAQECASLRETLAAGRPVTLTLCGERNAQSWSSASQGGWSRRLGGLFVRKQAVALLEAL